MAEDMTFGEWLRRRRKQLDLTQREFANAVGCSAATIRKIESNDRRPSKQLAELMVISLDIPPGQQSAFLTFARSEPYKTTDPSDDRPVGIGQFDEPDVQIPQLNYSAKRQKREPIRHNIPSPVTPFIGRKAELSQLMAYLDDPNQRLVTIIGPGGIGKTRLILALAERRLLLEASDPRFRDGIFFIPLAALSTPDQIPIAMAEAFNLPLGDGGYPQRSPRERVSDYLREKRMLLLIDNFEHLLDEGGGALLVEFLTAAPEVVFFITSRERLRLRSEQLFLIHGLEFPALEQLSNADLARYTAVQLFLQSVQRVDHTFRLTKEDTTHFGQICRLVEGMPLALELAAGWVDTLPLAEIVAEIERGLDILETDLQDRPNRHQNIRTVIDTSWLRMDGDERSHFAQMSIFRGGFTRAAAEVITGASPRLLSRLVNKSLLKYDRERNRYQIHELLRQYGAEQLDQKSRYLLKAKVLARHSAYYCDQMEKFETGLKGEQQRDVLEEIDSEIDNICLAWLTAVEQCDVEQVGQAQNSLGYFLEWTGRFQEGQTLFAAAAASLKAGDSPNADRVRVALLGWQEAFEQILTGGVDATFSQNGFNLLAALKNDRFDLRREEAFLYYQLGRSAADYDTRKEALGNALTLYRQLGADWEVANTLQLMGEPDSWFGGLDKIETDLEECLAIRRSLGDKRGIAYVLILLSTLARYHGRFEEALPMAEEAHLLFQASGIRLTEGRSYFNLGMSYLHLAQFEKAAEMFLLGVELNHEQGHVQWEIICDYGLAEAYFALGDVKKVLAHKVDASSLSADSNRNAVLGQIALIEGDYQTAEAIFQEALTHATETKNEMNISMQCSLLSIIAFQTQRFDLAQDYAKKALNGSLELRHFVAMQHSFRPIILLVAAHGDLVRAAELYGLMLAHHPIAARSWGWRQLDGPFLGLIDQLPEAIKSAALERGRALDYWETAANLMRVLEGMG